MVDPVDSEGSAPEPSAHDGAQAPSRDARDRPRWHESVSRRMPRVKRAVSVLQEHGPHVVRGAVRGATVHRMTLIVVLVAAGIVLFVPQIKVLFRWPSGVAEWAVLFLSGSAALAIQAVGWLCVLPIKDVATIDQALLGDPRRLPARLHRLLDPAGRAIDTLLAYFEGKPRFALALLVIALGLFSQWSHMTPLLFHAVLFCFWLYAQRFRDKLLWAVLAPVQWRVTASKLLGRSITVILITNALLEVLWLAQEWLPQDLRYRVYSTWAILQTLFAIALAVRVIDVLGLFDLPLIRVWPFVVLFTVLAFIPGGERVGGLRVNVGGLGSRLGLVGHASASVATDDSDNAWFGQLVARLDEIPNDQPVVLVAASGGGSRAAITAALVYEELARMPVTADRTLADNVLLISSVSGGSLATAYFLTHASAATARAATRFDPQTNEFVREMGTDFMAPLLRGVLNLRQERGSAVAAFWRDRYHWEDITDTSARAKGRPLAVFNATHVQSGARVGFGIPALPAGLLSPALVAEELDPGLELDLADAVRMSANFPYGFEHAVLGADPETGKAAEIIDGGVVDNTGLDTLALLLEGVQRATTAPAPTEAAQKRRLLSQRARAGLLQRGILVLEIDAGARPSEPTGLAAHFPSFSKPLEAMSRAGHFNGGALRAQHLARLRAALPTGGAPAVVGVVRAGFDCNSQGDVITAWALDYDARREIFREFAHTEGRLTRALNIQREAIQRLQALRRATVVEAPSAAGASPNKGEEFLRARYEEYVEGAMKEDAVQHASAPGCSPPEDSAQPGASEKALRAQLDEMPQRAPAAQPLAAPQAMRNARAAAPPSAAEVKDSAALGWVYVGERDGSNWQTKRMRWKAGRDPHSGDVVQLVTASNVRESLPDDEGRLAPVRMPLPASAELKVLETKTWGDTPFVWARVAVPQALAPKAAGGPASAPAAR